MPLDTVRDIMISLDEYVVVDDEATILEALSALSEGGEKATQGKAPHRAVLVRDSNEDIVGKVGHHAFMAGLEPQYTQSREIPAASRTGLSDEFLNAIMQRSSTELRSFDDYVRVAMNRKVADVMHPMVDASIDIDDDVRHAVHRLIEQDALSLLVVEQGEVVGVVRLVDLFAVVTKLIRRRSDTLSE